MRKRTSFGAGARAGFAVAIATALCSSIGHAAVPTPDAPAKTESVYKRHGLLGPVRIGPTFGVGAPEGLRAGIIAKYKGWLALGVAGSMVPELSVPGLDASVSRVSGEVSVRVHPFQKGFFVGVAGGMTQTKGTLTEQTKAFRQSQRADAHAYAGSTYVAPQVGFQWLLPFGMTLGCDVGVEFPVGSTGPTFDVSKFGLNVSADGKGSLADAVKFANSQPIPVVHLLEVGFLL